MNNTIMDKNIFKNACFGKAYKTRDGKKAIYHGSKEHKSSDGKIWTYHYLMIEPVTIDFFGKDVVVNHYDAYINDNGIGRFANLKYYKDSGGNANYDIISEWEELIDEDKLNEDKLNELANEYEIKYTKKDYESLKGTLDYEWAAEINGKSEGFIDGFKAGYRKAKS